MSDYETFASALIYDPASGSIVSRVPRGPWPAGRIVGGVFRPNAGTLYWRIKFAGGSYLAHRVAWLLHEGAWPDGEIDHADGDGLNNRWDNLRLASRSEQCRNVRPARSNVTRCIGVSFHKGTGKYMVRGRLDGREKYLGVYATVEEAASVSREFRVAHYGRFAPGARSYVK